MFLESNILIVTIKTAFSERLRMGVRQVVVSLHAILEIHLPFLELSPIHPFSCLLEAFFCFMWKYAFEERNLFVKKQSNKTRVNILPNYTAEQWLSKHPLESEFSGRLIWSVHSHFPAHTTDLNLRSEVTMWDHIF